MTAVVVALALVAPWQPGLLATSAGAPGTATPAAACPVTPYAEAGPDESFTYLWYGHGALVAGLYPDTLGVWYADPEGEKVQWFRPPDAPLSVAGARLDGPAPPLAVTLPEGYESQPFQVSRLVFPAAGCWAVTGRIPGAELRFVVWVHPGEQYRSATPVPPGVWAALERPLAVPRLAAGDRCPRSAVGRAARVEGEVLGTEPVYAQGLGSGGVVRLPTGSDRAAPTSIPVRLIADPTAAGPLLIRAQRLDQPGPIGFGPNGTVVALQRDGAGDSTPPDWRLWREDFPVPGPGCYALQVDGITFTAVIVFEVV